MGSQQLAAYEVVAFNTAAASENKIHDASIARELGYHGAVVPGATIYAYMAHIPVARWGYAWLECGEAECRFRKPVYDGAIVRVTASEESNGLKLCVESAGVQCATGHASIGEDRPLPRGIHTIEANVPPQERPMASETSLAAGACLGIAPLIIDDTMLSNYLDAICETDPVYRAEKAVHPGQILQLANRALLQNVILGPWIHLSSKLRHYAVARVGNELTLRAKISSNVVIKGHATIEFDAIVVADGKQTIAEINYVAIWRPRQDIREK
jgi:acyl dehydratase